MGKDTIKILIADDDESLRDFLTEAVSSWGYSASVACDGEEALRRLMMDRYDIVITDLMMPGMDGLSLLEKIQGLDGDILVIIITGYATIETAVKAIESGAYDYIAKPFRLDELMLVLKNASERLRLVAHNKTLLEELRSAHGEITTLKGALARSGMALEEEEGAALAAVESQQKAPYSPLKQKEYLKEADRFLINKPPLKA